MDEEDISFDDMEGNIDGNEDADQDVPEKTPLHFQVVMTVRMMFVTASFVYYCSINVFIVDLQDAGNVLLLPERLNF